MSESTLAGHAGSLYVRRWEREDPERIVVLVHGYGEHIGRHEQVAQALAQRGATVWGHDHAGHGRSDGERALVADFEGWWTTCTSWSRRRARPIPACPSSWSPTRWAG